MIDPGEDEDIQQQQKHADGYRHGQRRGIALVVARGELPQKIVRPRTQVRVLQRPGSGRDGRRDRRVRGALGGRYHAGHGGWFGGRGYRQWRRRKRKRQRLGPHRPLVEAGTLRQVMVAHADLVARSMQLGQQIQPQGHLVAPVMRPHFRTATGLQVELIYRIVRVPERRAGRKPVGS